MGYGIATITNSGGTSCHFQMITIIKTLAEANGWTTLRYVNSGANWEWIGKGSGLTGSENIYAGFKTYDSVSSDYYNLVAGCFTGFITGNPFETQPGIMQSGIPAHNISITYFLTINAQRINLCMKVGTPVYTFGGVGKIIPYGWPDEIPSPLFCAGMLNGQAATRYSDANLKFPYIGYAVDSTNCNLYFRDIAGNWAKPWCHPYSHKNNANATSYGNLLAGTQGQSTMVPAGTNYQFEPIILGQQDSTQNPSNIWGELDGIQFISGFSNGAENVVQVGGSSVIDQTGLTVLAAVAAILAVSGRAFVVLENVYRTTWADFIAMEMS